MDILALVPQFGSLLYTIGAFIVALLIIVAVHEYGHYIVGRWSGIKAEVFSLGFGPVLLSRVDRHGTRWQIAALPLGGYVKFLGDSDASSHKDADAIDQMDDTQRRQTVHGAPLWARVATVAAGPVFNFALSILIFSAVIFSEGTPKTPLTVDQMQALPTAGVTLQEGDAILAVADVPVTDLTSLSRQSDAIPQQALVEYRVRRDGREQLVQGPHPFLPLVSQVAPRSAAYAAGLKQGDIITALDGAPVYAFAELVDAVEGSNGRTLALTIWRDGQIVDIALAPKRVDEPGIDGGFVTKWRIGVVGKVFFEPATESMGVIGAVTSGMAQVWFMITGSLSGLWHMITGAISTCNMSGPVGIAEVSGAMASQGAQNFVWFIGALSTAVGLLNLFPVPVLDGGHLTFYLYEAVAGRPPSDKVLNILMAAGLAVVLSLMVFALGNDLFCP